MGILRNVFVRIVRWLLVMAGAALGSYLGRVAGAISRGEPVDPLLRVDRATVLRSDAIPGFLAVEFVGRIVRLGPLGAALIAATGAGVFSFLEGPIMSRKPPHGEPARDEDEF